MQKTLSYDEVNDLVEGARILGTGGGGNAVIAKKNIKKIYSMNKKFKIQDISDFKSEDAICIVGEVGGGISEQDKKFVEGLTETTDNIMIDAINELEQYLGIKFTGFVATEIGPGNIIVPLTAGALLGDRVTVDGDMCGRSKPKISISTTAVLGISITPLIIVSKYGDRIILKNAVSDQRAEDICRIISRLSYGTIGVARCPMKIHEAENALAKRTISLAIRLGQGLRNAVLKNKDPILVIEQILDARLLFIGKVIEFIKTEQGGFTSGTITLGSKNKILKIWYQNEYLISWLNGELLITCPDSIYVVDRKSGRGLTPWGDDFNNTDREIAVFARPSISLWKTEKGLKIFGPQIFKPDISYHDFLKE